MPFRERRLFGVKKEKKNLSSRKDIFTFGLALVKQNKNYLENHDNEELAMLDFIKSIFTGTREGANVDNKVNSRNEVAPGTEIHYDPNLVARFTHQHVELVNEIQRVKRFLHLQDYKSTVESLRTFKALLQQHLLEENLRFYTYLSHCLTNDAEGRELMSEMRNEMGEIGRLVTRFIKHYLEFGISDLNADKFDVELTAIIGALADRIKREENSLYTLYFPPSVISR